MGLELKIVSPSRVEFNGSVERVVVPGVNGQFEILPNHAPIISTLEMGKVVYQDSEGLHDISIVRGFVEVQKNKVDVCVEME